MVTLAKHNIRMSDPEVRERVGSPLHGLRRPHLLQIEPLEEIVRELSPLPISYDICRAQPPFFEEFTYTEMMGGMVVFPQSCELAARVVERAAENFLGGTVPAWFVESLLATGDKYSLDSVDKVYDQIVILPGSNLFEEMVCKHTLTRVMHENPDAMLKPHPLTNDHTLTKLGRLFGYRRVLEPKASGWAYLKAAKKVYYTTATEMGLYAILMGKQVGSVTNIRNEGRGTFAPFYRLCRADLTEAQRAGTLAHALYAPGSGFVLPGAPDVRESLRMFFEAAMELREFFRPRVMEYDPVEYSEMVRGAQRVRPHDGIRESQGRPGIGNPQVPPLGAGGSGGFPGDPPQG